MCVIRYLAGIIKVIRIKNRELLPKNTAKQFIIFNIFNAK